MRFDRIALNAREPRAQGVRSPREIVSHACLRPIRCLLATQSARVAPALTIWSRLEPVPFSADLADSLRAGVADPRLVACATVAVRRASGRGRRIAGDGAGRGRAGDGEPVRYRVLCVPVWRLRRSTMTTRACLRRCRSSGRPRAQRIGGLPSMPGAICCGCCRTAGATAVAEALRAGYRLTIPAIEDEEVDREASEWTAFLAADIPDARAIAAALDAARRPDGTLGGLPDGLGVSAVDAAAALPVVERWRAWYASAISEGKALPPGIRSARNTRSRCRRR